MKKSAKIAYAIKEHLVQLALDGKLPLDLNELDEFVFINIIEGIDESEEEIQKKRIENAGLILFEDEISIEEQIKLIEEYGDISHDVYKSTFIDEVDGVTTCQGAEWSYTIGTFLDSI